MEQEMTVKELIALVNGCEGDFMIQVEIKEGDASEERYKESDG